MSGLALYRVEILPIFLGEIDNDDPRIVIEFTAYVFSCYAFALCFILPARHHIREARFVIDFLQISETFCDEDASFRRRDQKTIIGQIDKRFDQSSFMLHRWRGIPVCFMKGIDVCLGYTSPSSQTAFTGCDEAQMVARKLR